MIEVQRLFLKRMRSKQTLLNTDKQGDNMTKIYTFNADLRKVGAVPKKYSTDEIRNERMLFGASLDFLNNVKESCPIAHAVTDQIITRPDFNKLLIEQACKGYHPVIDTKVVMLMPDFVPCIGGWHCDGVIRKDQQSQPDLSTVNEDIWHYITTISDCTNEVDHCGTEVIADMTVKLPLDLKEGTKVWNEVDNKVNEILDELDVAPLANGEIVRFNRATLHRGQVATKRQWRFFYRLSFYHMPAANEFRNQVQVYTSKSGW